MVFILQFVNMVYHIDDLRILKNPCIPAIDPHLMMVYEPFNVLLDSVCYYFVEDFCIYVHQ